jgi:hypothetical protein
LGFGQGRGVGPDLVPCEGPWAGFSLVQGTPLGAWLSGLLGPSLVEGCGLDFRAVSCWCQGVVLVVLVLVCYRAGCEG